MHPSILHLCDSLYIANLTFNWTIQRPIPTAEMKYFLSILEPVEKYILFLFIRFFLFCLYIIMILAVPTVDPYRASNALTALTVTATIWVLSAARRAFLCSLKVSIDTVGIR